MTKYDKFSGSAIYIMYGLDTCIIPLEDAEKVRTI